MSSSRASFASVSRHIQAEKLLKHVGSARVRLDVLEFHDARALDVSNVERLKTLFRGQRGCNPEELQNRIPAIIDETHLHDALRLSNISRESLRPQGTERPKLDFAPGFRLRCLRGQHRVRAAEEVLRSSEPRWVIDLFVAGTYSERADYHHTDNAKTLAKKRSEIS